MTRAASIAVGVGSCCLLCIGARGETTVFFDSSQVATLVSSGVTSDTIRSHGYLFTCTRDKLFTGGTGHPIGRPVRVPWPDGVEAQAVTTPPPGQTDHSARITLQRVDGAVFDLTTFTAQLLANTGGAGASFEIMPLVNGEDAFNDPLVFDATGYYGGVFSYDTSPNPLGSTALLTGYATYKITLYVDFALIGLTLHSDVIPGDFDGDRDVDENDLSALELCIYGPDLPLPGSCQPEDLDYDNDVDLSDVCIFQHCYSGRDNPADPDCSMTAR